MEKSESVDYVQIISTDLRIHQFFVSCIGLNAECHIEIDPTKQQNCNNEKVDNISK